MSNNLSQNILRNKEKLDDFLSKFITDYQLNKNNHRRLQELLNQLIKAHLDLLNSVSNAIGQSHQQKDFFYNKDLQNDYIITTENFLRTSFKTIDLIDKLIKKHNLKAYKIGDKAYYTLQKLINTFSDNKKKESLKTEFINRNIDLSGFKVKFKKMKQKYLSLQLYIGLPLLAITLLIIFFGENLLGTQFNGIQLIGIKSILSLSISIVGSSLIEGNVETNWTFTKGLTIRAIGWVAVFLLLYYINPANPGEVY